MSIGRASAPLAVRASGLRWLRTRADALHLQRGRRLARVLDLDVMTGRAGDARVRSRTLVLARDHLTGPEQHGRSLALLDHL
mgnify:CR=1 FL=1